MRAISPKRLVKILLLVLAAGLLIFSAKDIYDSLLRVARVNEELVSAYRPSLDVESIRQAAEILRSGH